MGDRPTAEQHAEALLVLAWLCDGPVDPDSEAVLQAAATRVWESLGRVDGGVVDD